MERYLNSVVDCYLDHKDFKGLNIGQNLIRIFVIGSMYTVFECIGLLLSYAGVFHSNIRSYVLAVVVFHIVYLPLVALAYRKKWLNRAGLYEWLATLYYAVVLVWASVFTALVYLDTEDITIYSIVLFLISAMFIIEPNKSSVLYIANFVFFAALVYSGVRQISMANAIVFRSLIVTVLSLIVSHGNYLARKSIYESKCKLEEANIALRDKAARDSLTQLFNNQYIFEYLESEHVRVQSDNGSMSLIMIDIDNFKAINDRFGHLFGDKVIRRVADAIRGTVRHDDVVGRYGGEEFIVVLSNTPGDVAKDVAEKIRRTVEDLHFDENAKITVSLGVSELSQDNFEFLVESADFNLYKAKHTGKNRVVA